MTENKLKEIIENPKIKTKDKIKFILEFNNKVNISIIANILNCSKMNISKTIKKHSIKYEKLGKKRNEILFKQKKNYKTYIIKDLTNNIYKIGKSVNPKLREKTLQSEKPSIKIIKVFNKNIENELHLKYSKNRIRGEWFNLNEIQIRYICTHY
jgi:recombinational DNA repair ATPase RecF